jgi:hypothetical protein
MDNSQRPDIVLSLGTGIEASLLTSSGTSIATAKQSFVGSFVRAQSQRDRASSPTRCQRAANDFASNLPSSVSPSPFVRFNPVSMITLPASDDIAQMKPLQNLARSHIDSLEIKTIAAKLLATLFYFENVQDVVVRPDGRYFVQGSCMLKHTSKTRVPNF